MYLKKILLFLALIIGAISSVHAQDASNGIVYFMRNTGYQGSVGAFTTFIDGKLACKLNNKNYSIHQVAPGKHTFAVQFAGKEAKEKAELITINIEAGKTYYIQMIIQMGLIANNLYCQEVTESSAQTILPKLKEDKKCL